RALQAAQAASDPSTPLPSAGTGDGASTGESASEAASRAVSDGSGDRDERGPAENGPAENGPALGRDLTVDPDDERGPGSDRPPSPPAPPAPPAG
ncbi:hypothetical protein DY240_23380, partial [Jiangella rhizosphaerae]